MSINAINMKPLKVIGILVALHSFVYGVGYITGWGGFPSTLLFSEVSTLFRPEVFGLALLSTGTTLVYAYMHEKMQLISHVSTVQSFIWLFATLVYVLNGDWLVGIAIGFIWSVMSGYISYLFRFRYKIIEREAARWYLSEDF